MLSAPRTRHRLAAAAGIAIGAALLAWSVRGIDFDALRQSLRAVDWGWLVPVVAAYVAVFWCKAWRFAIAMRPVRRVSPGTLVPAMFASNLGNLVLPAYAGEVTRAVVLSRTLSAPVASVLSAALIERLLDFVVLLGLLTWLLLASEVVPPAVDGVARAVGLATLLLIVAIGIAIAARERIGAFAARFAERTRSAWLARMAHAVVPALQVLQTLSQPRLAAGLIASSVLHWALLGLCTHFALLAAGVPSGWQGAASVLTLVTAAMTAPSSPGWIGAVQIGFVLGLRPYGVQESEAFAASIVFHACVYFTALFAGLACLRSVGLGWREVAGLRPTRAEPPRAA
jgi:glycosyltransferase 2 family protein